jgi:hypothetical protein
VLTSFFLSEGVYLSDFHEKLVGFVDAINNKQTKTVGEMAVSKLVFSQAPYTIPRDPHLG